MKANAYLPVQRALVAQLGSIAVLASVLAVYNRVAAYSALLGGVICLVANAYAGWRIFSPHKKSFAGGELYKFYRAEFGKLVMIGAMCAATFSTVEVINMLAFVAGFVGTMIAGTIGMVTGNTNKTSIQSNNRN